MVLVGALAILVGWLMILPSVRTAPAPSRRWLRYALAFLGTWFLTAGMAAVVQARH
jgi:hypothetical protein